MRLPGQLEGAAVICPHCEKSLRHRERGGRTCSVCKRTFALEPKDNTLHLHDVRMRKLIERLGNGEGLRYTPAQLWYAAARNHTPTKAVEYGTVATCSVVIWAFVLLVISGGSGWDPDVVRPAIAIGVVVLVLTILLTVRASRRAKRNIRRVEVPMSLATFRTAIIGRWVAVYGSPPAGLTDEGRAQYPVVPGVGGAQGQGRPRLALLCPDRDVLAFLALNGAHKTHSLALVRSVDQLRNISAGPAQADGPGAAGVVGIVLHDASPAGLAFASEARAALGGRAVVAGMPPRTVMDKTNAVRLRKPLDPGDLEAIRMSSSALTAEEADWLTGGWWSPLAAVPPAKLMAVVARAVDRAEGLADPDRGRARQVGFLTWPTAS